MASLTRPMNLMEAIVLGIVQGLTEFLPISSSAHQRIVPALFGWEDPGAAFTAVTQLGTETAVLIYFRHELWAIATTWLRSLRDPRLRCITDARLGWYLIVATIPIGVLGLAFEEQIENGARNLWLIGTVLIVFGLVLGYADRHGRHEREISQFSVRDGILIGLAQSLALIPGVSRSGATMSAGLLLGLQRPAAAKFGFLLAVPAVVASGVFQLEGHHLGRGGRRRAVRATWRSPRLIAFVVGYAAIAWFLRYLAHHSVRLFVDLPRCCSAPCPGARRRRGAISCSAMAKLFDEIGAGCGTSSRRSRCSSSATAPSGYGGHVNLSPKGGHGLFRVTGPLGFAYVDLVGSGVETIAHLRENGRITIMFCRLRGAAEDRPAARRRPGGQQAAEELRRAARDVRRLGRAAPGGPLGDRRRGRRASPTPAASSSRAWTTPASATSSTATPTTGSASGARTRCATTSAANNAESIDGLPGVTRGTASRPTARTP